MPKRRKKSGKKKQVKRFKQKSIYDPSSFLIDSNLELIDELNKQLSESIEQNFEERTKTIWEKVPDFDKKTQGEIASCMLEISNFIDGIIKRGKIESEKSVEIHGSEKTGEFLIELFKIFHYKIKFDEFIRNMSLVYLVAIFKSFLQSVLSITFQIKPEILSSSKKMVSWEDLAKLESLDEVRKRMIEREIKSIIDKDIEEIDKYLINQFNTSLSQYPDWNNFKERFYRRNIIIHNLGRIDKRYRQKTGYTGYNIELKVPQEYLNETIELFRKRAEGIIPAQTELKENETFYMNVQSELEEIFVPLGYSEDELYSILQEASELTPNNPHETIGQALQPQGSFKYLYSYSDVLTNRITEESELISEITENPIYFYESTSITTEPSEIIIQPGDTQSFELKITNPTADTITFNVEIILNDLPCLINMNNFQITLNSLETQSIMMEISLPRSYDVVPVTSSIEIKVISISLPQFILQTSIPIEILPFHEITASITTDFQEIFDNEDTYYEIEVTNHGNILEAAQLSVKDLTIATYSFDVNDIPLNGGILELFPGETRLVSLNVFPNSLGMEEFSVIITTPEISITLSTMFTVVDDDITPPVVTISYSGSKTDGDPGYWEVTAFDESGLLQDPSGFYYLNSDLGSQTLSIVAEDADNDLLGDSLLTTATNSISIVDDDITPPIITDFMIDVSLNILTVSFTVFDMSGINAFYFTIDGVPVMPKTQSQIDNFYVFELEYIWLLELGNHELQVVISDADLDRGLIDQLSTTISIQFEQLIEEIFNVIFSEIEDLKIEVDECISNLFDWIVIGRLDSAENFLNGALDAYLDENLPLTLVLEKLAKVNIELSNLLILLFDWIGIISSSDSELISNSLHIIRDHITFLMGTVIGTFDALTLANTEIQTTQLADKIFKDYSLSISLSINIKLWIACDKIDLALYCLATNELDSMKNYLNSAILKLDCAKTLIIQYIDSGSISESEALVLISLIEAIITQLSEFL